MAKAERGDHDHIQKARNFPAHLLKSIRNGEALECPDLHGYTCETARKLMCEAFSVELNHPNVYTFIIGCGRHSLEKYRVELQKACAEGLREAGLEEDRHASAGAIGRFKVIDDKSRGMHMVKVFPRASASAASEAGPRAADADADDMAATAAVHAVLARCHDEELAQSSLLGLAEAMDDLFPVLLESKECKRLLEQGQQPTALQSCAFSLNDELLKAWKESRRLLLGLEAPMGISLEERNACLSLIDRIRRTQPTSEFADKLRSLADGMGERREPDPALKRLEQALKKLQAQLETLESTCKKWEAGRHRFSSVQEQSSALQRRAALRKEVAESEQWCWAARRRRTAVNQRG